LLKVVPDPTEKEQPEFHGELRDLILKGLRKKLAGKMQKFFPRQVRKFGVLFEILEYKKYLRKGEVLKGLVFSHSFSMLA
jgi:hypothetical protein